MYTSDVTKTMTYPVRVFSRRYIPFWGRVRVVRISPLVAPIRKACLTCTVLLYEGVSHASWVNFFAKKFEWTINIKINLFTSFDRWYGLQITKQISK